MQALSKASRITNPHQDIAQATPMRGEMPLDPAMLRSLGKPIAELLGASFKLQNGTGLPSLLKLTGWNAAKGTVGLHGARAAGEAFEATPAQLDELIEKGILDLAQPAMDKVSGIRGLLAKALGQQ